MEQLRAYINSKRGKQRLCVCVYVGVRSVWQCVLLIRLASVLRVMYDVNYIRLST